MLGGTTHYDLFRGEECFPLSLEFTYTPIIPATGPSWDSPGEPAEGGEIETLEAFFADHPFPLTPEEYERIEAWLYANYPFDDEPYNPEEP